VIGYITADAIPAGFTPPAGITGPPLAPGVADHVAAVALFGKPSNGFLNSIDRDAPPITVGHLYSGKTIDLCIPEDPICSPGGNDNGAHTLYSVNGMTGRAAEFGSMPLLACAAGRRLDQYPNLLKDDLGAPSSAPVHTVSVSGPPGGI
jgi:cutinase